MFLIDEFSISKYEDYQCAIVLQKRQETYYIWNGIFYFNINLLSNKHLLDWNICEGCDVGGSMKSCYKI